jgi:hypothetical protein
VVERERECERGKGEGDSSHFSTTPSFVLSLLSPDLAVSRRSRVNCNSPSELRPGLGLGRSARRIIKSMMMIYFDRE